MFIKNKVLAIFAIFFCLNLTCKSFAEELLTQNNKFPDYAYEYLGMDKYENFNRKMFNFNLKLNKYAIRPVHTIWASVMPKYGVERIQSAYSNIEYPKRLVSSLLQKDFKSSGTETLRFLTNTTLGLGGLYDPAKNLFKIETVQEDMEQALTRCKIKSGPYLVIPVISSTSPRDIAGRLLDTALNPSSYVATPVMAMVKAGLLVNRTSYMQPIVKMVESNYADPYDIAKKIYAIEKFIKTANLDRKNVLENTVKNFENNSLVNSNEDTLLANSEKEFTENEQDEVTEEVLNIKKLSLENPLEEKTNTQNNNRKAQGDRIVINDIIKGGTSADNIILKGNGENTSRLFADMLLFDYHPQNPVTDSMRTALFDLPEINDSIWSEISVWNRSFSKQIKTDAVNVYPTREDYNFKYILQKNKKAPVAIVYPSIGEGICSHHSVVLAKLFYDEGYSVIIQGSNFQWEFVKSMPEDYRPGMPSNDAKQLKIVTSEIINSLERNHNCKFSKKIVIGTSFGALTTLFLAENEARENAMNIDKYISINPPIELIYAMKQVDKNNYEWEKNRSDLKSKVATTAAKVIQVSQQKSLQNIKIETLPFSDEEAKLITGFVMHQKLSDLIFSIENGSKSKKTEIYNMINNMSYQDYAKKYLLTGEYKTLDDLNFNSSLHSISEYLRNNNNYKIYHTLDDYLVNQQQLKQLKKYSDDKTVLINNGSHLGFLYRQEFIDALKKEITLK